jgi:iron(III) transport system substrate-binding protein
MSFLFAGLAETCRTIQRAVKSGYSLTVLGTAGFFLLSLLPSVTAQSSKASSPQAEWDRTLEAAKKEGIVVVSIPASAELRKGIEDVFPRRYGIKLELFPARGAQGVQRIAQEFKAGVRYFDVHIGGTASTISGLLVEGMLEPVEPLFVLPEVRNPKNWWGGHIWADKANQYIYSFQAYLTDAVWYNTTMMKPEEIKSYDDMLHPKWKGKIGFLDPRTPGAGDATWAFMWEVKGEDFLKKLVAQNLVLGRDQRLLAENVAKGRLAFVLGLTHYTFLPFIKAGLPVKSLPPLKEGAYATAGSGNLTVIKNAPHPNASRVFVNWLLAREGQEIFGKTMGQGSRRLDVDTQWLKEFGVIASKDGMTLEEYYKWEGQSEEKISSVRNPALAVAQKLLE